MKKTFVRIIVIVLAIALLLSVMLPLRGAVASASGQITQGDIDDMKDELADIAEEKKRVNARLSAIRGDLSKAKETVELLQQIPLQ